MPGNYCYSKLGATYILGFLFNLSLQPNADVLIVSAERWTDLIEQTTMLMMILGRWLLPTVQGMTKDSLSQLLLVNLAMCADIIEFFDILKLDFVRSSPTLIATILCLWTWSLMQFPFNTMSKLDPEEEEEEEGTTDRKLGKVNSKTHSKRSIVPYSTGIDLAAQEPNRASMTSMDFKRAIAAKRLSRDILLMSHNYSRGLPRGYLPDVRRNSYQPHLGEKAEVLNNNLEPKTTQIKNLQAEPGSSNGHQREPGRFSLPTVGQMRPKRKMGHMTTSMTSPNLRLEFNEGRDATIPSEEKITTRPSSPAPGTCVDMGNEPVEETTKSRITPELVGILMSLFMQDGPFLTFRLLIIAQHQAYEYMVIFLTAKNALVLALQVYRLCVLHCTCYDHKENDFSPDNEIDANSRLKNVQVAVTHENKEKCEDGSVHTAGWNFTGRWRRSFKGPFFYSRAFNLQDSHLAP